MAAWEETRSAATSPTGPSSAPSSTPAAARSTTCSTMARSSPPATPRRSTRPSSRRQTDLESITAVRLELLNDPNLPRGGPGRSIDGLFGLTEFKVVAAPADGTGRREGGQDRLGHGRRQPARGRRSAPIFDDKTDKTPRDRAGRLRHRRQERDRLGHRHRPRPQQRPAQGGLRLRGAGRLPRRRGADVQARPEPRRLEQRRQPEQQPRPVPLLRHRRPDPEADPLPAARPGDPRRPAGAADPGPDRRRLLATGGRPSPSGTRPTPRSRHSGTSTPRARRSSSCRSATSRGRPTVLERGDFLKPAEEVEPGVPAFLHPLPDGRPARPARLRPLAGRPRLADDGAVDRQPRLAGVLRHRARRDARGPRLAEPAAVASRTARLAGRRVHGLGLEPEAPAPADRHDRDLPAIVDGHARTRTPATRTTACWPAGRGSGSMPRSSATSPWRPAAC